MNRPNDELSSDITPPPVSTPNAPRPRRRWAFQLAALGLTLVSALAGTGLAYWLKSPAPQPASPPATAGKGIPVRLFPNWGKPDFVIILSAQQHGYMLPCGCSEPQVGGLERRYNFIQLLKARGWPVVAVDLGDVPQKHGPAKLHNVQGLIKYRYSMMALKEMGYLAVGVGEYEAGGSWPLASIEGEWAANFSQPAVLAANLKAPDNFPLLKADETQTVPGTSVKVGVTNIVGPSVAENIKDPTVKFNPSAASLREQIKKMHAENVDVPILLYHGLATGRKEAVKCAEAFPDFPIILALSEEDEPPAHPISVDHKSGIRNYVFRLGHKGKYIGVLGVYRNGASFNFKYQLVEMGTEYVTPPEQETTQPIRKMMEDYTRELKNNNYLAKYGQSKHILQAMEAVPGLRNPGDGTPAYIGSKACGKCHEHAYEVWNNSKHSHAYQTLVGAKHPSLRQYDGECIVCHTVGFGYKTGFTDGTATPKLKDVGCESCHGPGSLHAKNPDNQVWRERMNLPWLDARKKGNEQAKNLAIEKFCVTCHDIDNDVTWIHKKNKNPFLEKWVNRKIIHNNPQEK
ncbi:MAG TPA: multiheme c-type cytochrome [Gemmataceae bacterium]|nr:multiheme c-type cytochrome [Gemmataceae bacterium]